MRDPTRNILQSLDPKDAQTVRQLLIEIVFATDMGYHFDILAAVRATVKQRSLKHEDPADRLLLMKLAIKVFLLFLYIFCHFLIMIT